MSDPALSAYLKQREFLITIACRVVESRAVAEEIVQDSWLRWHNKNYPAADARRIFRRIVENLARDWRRRQQMEGNFLAHGLPSDFLTDLRDAERALIAQQELRRIVSALDELPPRMVSAFRMRRIGAAL